MNHFDNLYFSENCFGTTDAIYYKNGILRIHDLKTGIMPAHMEQLEIYAALFLLEYEKIFGVSPQNTKVNLRIYPQRKRSLSPILSAKLHIPFLYLKNQQQLLPL